MLVKDLIAFLSALTLRRGWNFLVSNFSFGLSVILRKPVVLGRPYSISIEPTTRCNLSCPECPVGNKSLSRQKGDISVENFKEILEKVQEDILYANLFLQGEPMMHPRLEELISAAAKKKIYTCISTNGHFLNGKTCAGLIQSGLSRIIISLDGTDEASYQLYRKGGNFNKVLSGIQTLIKTRENLKLSHPLVILQFIVFGTNEHQVPEVKKLGKKLGVDKVVIKSAQHYNLNPVNELISKQARYSRYRLNEAGDWELRRKYRNRCKRIWTTAVVTREGDLISCCFDKNADYAFGNMLQQNLTGIWNGPQFVAFRKRILTERASIDICRNCNE